MANMRQNSVNASKCQKLHRNLHSLCKSLHSLCKVYTICVNENYNYIFCVKQIAKSYSCLYISCINCDVNKNCDLSLGKLPSTLWCFMIIYTADKNFTWPPVAPVAPNINSALPYFLKTWWLCSVRFAELQCVRHSTPLVLLNRFIAFSRLCRPKF